MRMTVRNDKRRVVNTTQIYKIHLDRENCTINQAKNRSRKTADFLKTYWINKIIIIFMFFNDQIMEKWQTTTTTSQKKQSIYYIEI